jgi:hypothetical protein
MLPNIIITYAIFFGSMEAIYEEFKTYEDCETYIDINLSGSKDYDKYKCIEVKTIEY